VKLTIAIKNKWSARWMRVLFYCKVRLLRSPQGGNGVYALHSVMSVLDYATEPLFDCPNTDVCDVVFVQAVGLIRGRDIVEEYLACSMYPLSASFDFETITDGETSVSKLVMPLPEFCVARAEGESDARFLAKVELAVENVVGSYCRAKHDACIKSLPNECHLNRVLEKARIAYAPRPPTGIDASVEVARKRKVDAYDKHVSKQMKVAAKKRTVLLKPAAVALKKTAIPPKATTSKGKYGVKRPSDTELALAKAVKKSNKISLAPSSVPSSALGAAGASSSRGPGAPVATTLALDADPQVDLISMLGLVSSSESQESSSGDSLSSQFEGAPQSTANPTISSAMVVPEVTQPHTQLYVVASVG
jgi:hypothetical protein